MNIFIIPSWFPSKDHPVSGTMVKEQAEGFCRFYPHANIGISVWGQQDEDFLLWSKDHIRNLKKVLAANTAPYTTSLLTNLKVYYNPTFTWTRKILNGNFKSIIKANLKNLQAFETENGPADIIHAHVGFPAGLIAMEVAKKTKKPFCLTERMGPFPWPHTIDKTGMLMKYYKQPYIEATVNIAISPFQAEVMRKQGIENIKIIPNFINEQFFKPSPCYQPQTETFTFFTLSDITPQKGIDTLLNAIKILTQTTKDVLFRIGGIGPYIQNYKNLVSDLGIEQYVEWLGEINREAALHEFQFCDSFVLPSMYESMGTVYVEAIACGKPIIATKCGGPEATVTSNNGLLVDKNNSQELAQAMEYIIINRKKYEDSKIRKEFLERFSVKAIAPNLYNLYESIINKHILN